MGRRLAQWWGPTLMGMALVGCPRAGPPAPANTTMPPDHDPSSSTKRRPPVDAEVVHRLMDSLGDRIDRELRDWAVAEFPSRHSAVLALLVFQHEELEAKARMAEVLGELGIDPLELTAYLEQHPVTEAEVAKVARRVDRLLAITAIKRRLDELESHGWPDITLEDVLRENLVKTGATEFLAQMPRPPLPPMFRDWEEVYDRQSLEALLRQGDHRTQRVLLYIRLNDAAACWELESVLQSRQVQDQLADLLRVVIDVTEEPDPFDLGLHNVWRGDPPRLFFYRSGEELLGDIRSSDPAGPGAWYRWRGSDEVPSIESLSRVLSRQTDLRTVGNRQRLHWYRPGNALGGSVY